MESLGVLISAVLTLMVFSYIFGDNVLFKLAAHIFVGVAIGVAVVVVWNQVFARLGPGNLLTAFPALILCLLLIFKIQPVQSRFASTLGSISLAFMLGVGAALAVGGALFGTLVPQVLAVAGTSLNPNHYQSAQTNAGLVNWLNNIIIVLGTIGTFFYFTFAVRAPGPLGNVREGVVRFWSGMGRLMIIFTLGALFANTVSARVALLVSRLQFLINLPDLFR
ncbi:MAG: hypothetical protein D6768_00635 [Chloroflexi bacterium]|nr:MAG: hypothetical protein D6768_00635 [Chloroflexota bacterium]